MTDPRNVFERNWRRAALDVTVGRWRWPRLSRRTFRIFTAGPTEHRYEVDLGPVSVTFWPKARAAEFGSSTERSR